MKDAGAAILAKTNVPLALGDWQSYNDVYGVTNNPYDLDAHAGRLVGRLGGGAGCRLRLALAWLRHRRLAARARALLWRLRAQADLRPRAVARAHRAAVPPLPGDIDLAVIGPMARSAADLVTAARRDRRA